MRGSWRGEKEEDWDECRIQAEKVLELRRKDANENRWPRLSCAFLVEHGEMEMDSFWAL